MQRPDRRVARTRSALHKALTELMLGQDYETITVNDICNRADISRSAFYQHFAGKDDLFRTGFEQLRLDLVKAISAGKPHNQKTHLAIICHALFTHAERHANLYKATISGHAGMIASRRIGEIVQEHVKTIRPRIRHTNKAADAERALGVVMATSALLAALRWWLGSRRRSAREQIAQIVQSMLSNMLFA